MKVYVAPKLNCVELRIEERIADVLCTGSCTEDGGGYVANVNS